MPEDCDLNRNPLNIFKPSACQYVMVVRPNIVGINQFYSNITGNANSKAKHIVITNMPNAYEQPLIKSSLI
jgi:hypothetical protein